MPGLRDLKVTWIGLQGGADASFAADPLVGLFLGENTAVSPNYLGMALYRPSALSSDPALLSKNDPPLPPE